MPLKQLIVVWVICLLAAPTVSAGKLYIKTQPKDAKIIIWNIKPQFRQGMWLKSGKYDMQIQKPGYHTQRRWIRIGSKTKHFKFKLKPKTYRLFVDTEPKDAKVIVWNIKPKYQSGMRLPAGTYDIQVQKSGYVTERWKNVRIVDKDLHLPVRLERAPAPPKSAASVPKFRSLPVLPVPAPLAAAGSYALYVNPYPANARIRLLNYHRPYHYGMVLPVGRYQLQVDAPGHMSRGQWVDIVNQDVSLAVTLSPPARCYFARLPNAVNPVQMIDYRLDLQFAGEYVNGSYSRQPLPDGSYVGMTLTGVARGQTLDMVGTYYQGNRLMEIHGKVYLQGNLVRVDFEGMPVTLQATACQPE